MLCLEFGLLCPLTAVQVCFECTTSSASCFRSSWILSLASLICSGELASLQTSICQVHVQHPGIALSLPCSVHSQQCSLALSTASSSSCSCSRSTYNLSLASLVCSGELANLRQRLVH